MYLSGKKRRLIIKTYCIGNGPQGIPKLNTCPWWRVCVNFQLDLQLLLFMDTRNQYLIRLLNADDLDQSTAFDECRLDICHLRFVLLLHMHLEANRR